MATSVENAVEIDACIPLDEEQIALYLRTHPDFLQNHPDVLRELELVHDSGSALSLINRQMTVLREQNRDLKLHLDRLLEIARDNDTLFAKIRQLTLQLIECPSAADAIDTLVDQLNKDFQLEFCQLILFSSDIPASRHIKHDSLKNAQERIPSLLRAPSICGLLRLDELDYLFGTQGSLIGSAAVLHLSHQQSLGLLAVGHREREHFRSSMDTLFINYLGDVLVRIMERKSDIAQL